MPFNGTLFRTMFPELRSAELSFLRVQWSLAAQYAEQYSASLPLLNTNSFTALVAHLVKLNLIAQMGAHIDGYYPPILQPPADAAKFKSWLQQTSYGRSVGS